jgi:hypothetical protein
VVDSLYVTNLKIVDYLEETAIENPKLVKYSILGKSFENRSIPLLRVFFLSNSHSHTDFRVET